MQVKMMKINLLILFIVLGLTGCSLSQDTIDLFIWAGQSNAQGWQGDAEFYPSDPDSLDSQIRLNYTFIGSTSSNGWLQMQPQEGRFAAGHFGPEVTFGRKLVEAGHNPAIFKYTRGATSIYSDWLAPGEGGYYDAMVADLDIAIADLESQGYTVSIRGFVWIQGESDAETPAIARNNDHTVFTSMYGLSRADAYHLAPAGLTTHGERIFEALEPLLKK